MTGIGGLGRRARMMRQVPGRRFNSTQTGQKPVSPHVGFYKNNSRPIFKVLLMSVFIYQLTYWGWVKLEKDDIKSQKTGEWWTRGVEDRHALELDRADQRIVAELEGLEKRLGELTMEKKKP